MTEPALSLVPPLDDGAEIARLAALRLMPLTH